MSRFTYNFLLGITILSAWAFSARAQTRQTAMDSSFWHLSLPEIQSYQTYYTRELESLQQEKEYLIKRGIEDGEFLLKMNPDAKIVDQILIRLADLYYYREKDAYLNRMEDYDRQLTRFERGEMAEGPEPPRLVCQKSLDIYQRIIDEYPQSELVDDAVYNRGFLYEEMRQNIRANQIYLHLIDAYPESKYVPEAYMRLGEYYFNPPVSDLPKATGYYKQVLPFNTSPRYAEALYKLGWSYYRMSRYPEAISYFTTVVEDFEAVQKTDTLSGAGRVDLLNESIDYIAISFLDFGGPSKLKDYLVTIGRPAWGQNVLRKMGDIYMDEKEEYPLAVEAYQDFLDYAPMSEDAPVVQRRIVECYLAVDQKREAFEARLQLYENYRVESAWWDSVSDEKARLTAYRYTEQALRENFNSLLNQATSRSDPALFRNTVDMGLNYLKSFPEDLYAYMIRWNVALIMDEKLHQYKEALQEYLTISMVYTGSRYETFAREKGLASIQDAAENAIVVADSLFRQERRQLVAVTDTGGVSKDPMPLSQAESWLAMAYDNYLKLFPFDEKTPTILASAGVLYFTRNQFNEALKYFKTLTKYFPDSPQIQSVQYSILESYFGKKDYMSVEAFARRIMNGNMPSDMKRKASQRMGESIFLHAQALDRQGKSHEAADEYFRMALQTPTLEFADRALFNAAQAYERTGDFLSAIRAYEQLRTTYSGSSLLKDALNNLALNYGETGEFHKGGERYEALSTLEASEEKARNALYNAFVFFKNAESWEDVKRTAQNYAQKYPEAEDAPSVYFQTGDCYTQLGDTLGAASFYAGFSSRFPDSPLGVEAFYRSGKTYYDRREMRRAENLLLQAYRTERRLKDLGIDTDSFYAAEALFLASRLQEERFTSIRFKLPRENMNRAIEEKQELLRSLRDRYLQVAAYGTHRLPEAVFRVGALYENYARTWAAQDRPPLDPTSRAVKEKEINERTAQIYSQALNRFRRSADVIQRVINAPVEAALDSGMVEIEQEAVLASAEKWLAMSREKISESLYQMAEVNTATIEQLLEAPIPSDLENMARLEYRSQVLLKAVRPLLNIVTEAHKRNLSVGDSLDLDNRWIQASREKIVTSLGFLSGRFRILTLDALAVYGDMQNRCRKIAFEDRESVPENLAAGFINILDLCKSYGQVVIALSKEGVERAVAAAIPVKDVESMADTMVTSILQITDEMQSQVYQSDRDRLKAEEMFEASNDWKMEETLAIFEDNVYYMQENMNTLLETAYRTNAGFSQPAQSGVWLGVRLLRQDPETYSAQLQIPVRQITVKADTTWWVSPRHAEGWWEPQFQMDGWMRNGRFSHLSDKGVRNQSSGAGEEGARRSSSLYVRKSFSVPGYPVSGQARFQTGEPERVYINGYSLTEEEKGTAFEMDEHLKNGQNLLALQWTGPFLVLIEGEVVIHYVPGRVLPSSGGQQP
jgi:TolA-binding protein